jgi:fumiquinazoline A oxidase
MVGLTVGAGIGILQGVHGLMIDALISVRMVTASGDIVMVSKTENSDLFWAIRGAGANFGIVTMATYHVHDATNSGQVLNADFLFLAPSNRSVWELLRTFDDYIPPELSIVISTGYNHTTQQVTISNLDNLF